MVKRLLVLSSLLLFATGARAGVVVALEDNKQQANGDWIYDITLEQNTQMTAKDFFVIYDIPQISNASWDPNNEALDAFTVKFAEWRMRPADNTSRHVRSPCRTLVAFMPN